MCLPRSPTYKPVCVSLSLCYMQLLRPLPPPVFPAWPREVLLFPQTLKAYTVARPLDMPMLRSSPTPTPKVHLTHQQSLLARFPSLRLGLGSLAPEDGGIAWEEDKMLQSRGA